MSNLPFWKFLFKPEPSIIEKLKQAAYAAPRAVKTGNRRDFSYLQIQEVANAFWGETKDAGLLIIPNDLELFSDGEDAWVKTEFIVSDGISRERFVSFGQGHSAEGFATGIAQTMALKSFLKRLGMTFGEEDDQEQGRTKAVEAYVVPETPKQISAQQKYQERAWSAAIAKAGKTSEQIEQFLWEKWGVKEASSLPPAQFDAAICWLTTNGDLADSLELSKRVVARKKAQPVASILDRERDLAGD